IEPARAVGGLPGGHSKSRPDPPAEVRPAPAWSLFASGSANPARSARDSRGSVGSNGWPLAGDGWRGQGDLPAFLASLWPSLALSPSPHPPPLAPRHPSRVRGGDRADFAMEEADQILEVRGAARIARCFKYLGIGPLVPFNARPGFRQQGFQDRTSRSLVHPK